MKHGNQQNLRLENETFSVAFSATFICPNIGKSDAGGRINKVMVVNHCVYLLVPLSCQPAAWCVDHRITLCARPVLLSDLLYLLVKKSLFEVLTQCGVQLACVCKDLVPAQTTSWFNTFAEIRTGDE